MHRALFVCSQNRLRSPTAEEVFSKLHGIECASAGTDEHADVPIDPELIAWADTIYVMETAHKIRITKRFKKHLSSKRIVVLGIPDDYEFMQPELISLLLKKVGPLLAKYGCLLPLQPAS